MRFKDNIIFIFIFRGKFLLSNSFKSVTKYAHENNKEKC